MNESPRILSISRMPPSYHLLRRLHFRLTLKAWLRGLDKALLAFAGVLPIGFLGVLAVFVLVQANALERLLDAATPLAQRIAIVAGWQAVTFVLLRALREAVLMPRSRAFFAALPVSPGRELRSDLVFAAQGYSIAWAPLAWVTFNAHAGPALQRLASLAAVSLCANLALLRGRTRFALPALAALAVLALPAGVEIALASAAAVAAAGYSLWRSYLPGGSDTSRARRARTLTGGAARKLSLASGLALPFLANELRSNLGVRLGFIAGTFGACLLLATFRAEDAAGTRILVFVGAVAAVSLYALPALWRTGLLTKLHFVAGQAAFVRRIRTCVYGVPVLLFAVVMALAASLDAGESPRAAALVFGLLFAGGLIAARCQWQVASWLMPLLNFVAVIILGGIL